VRTVADLTISITVEDSTAIAKLAELQTALTKTFSGVGSSAQQGFAEATGHASKFQNFMSEVKSAMGGVFAVSIAQDFFRIAIEGAEKLKDALIDAGKQAASMEQMKIQLGIELGAGGVAASKEVVTNWVNKLQYFSDTTTTQLNAVVEAFRQTVATGYTPDKAYEMIQHITDVAAATTPAGKSPSEHFSELMTTFNQAIKGGALLERAIYPLEREGVAIRPFLEQRMGVKPGELGEVGTEMSEENLTALRKAVRGGRIPSTWLQEFFEQQTAPGGKYAGAAAQFGQTAIGGWSTLLDKFQNIMRGIGSVELGPFEAIINKINASFSQETYLKIQNFFDGIAKKVNEAFSPALTHAFDTLITALSKQDWSKLGPEFDAAIEGFVKLIKESDPLLEKFAKDLSDHLEVYLKIAVAIEKIGAAIEKAFGWMGKSLQQPELSGPSAADASKPFNLGDFFSNIMGIKDLQRGWEAIMKEYFPKQASDDIAKTARNTETIADALTGKGTP
jgi:hypothetical protein